MKVTITIDDSGEDLNVVLEFDPPIENILNEDSDIPLAGMIGIEISNFLQDRLTVKDFQAEFE